MNTSGKHAQKPTIETDSPLVAKYAWMTSDVEEEWENGLRNGLPEMPSSVRDAIQSSIHEDNPRDTGFEGA